MRTFSKKHYHKAVLLPTDFTVCMQCGDKFRHGGRNGKFCCTTCAELYRLTKLRKA